MSSSSSGHTLSAADIHSLRGKLHPELQTEQWYTILTAAAASAHIGAETVPLIYKEAVALHASSKDASADEAAIRIQRRIKEALVKGSVLFGIPRTLDSLFAFLPVLRAEPAARRDQGFFQRKGQTLEETRERGEEALRMVYRHNLDPILANMGDDMDDAKYLTLNINYGWNLSEHGVLDFPSTELVVLSSLIPQNAAKETLWHLRGCRRAGWGDAQISSVQRVTEEIATRSGCNVDKLPKLQDVNDADQ